jgi:hypothetical protein
MAELNLYEVQVRNHKTTMQLNDEDAQAFKDQDVEIKRVGSVEPQDRQDVIAPPHAVDEDGKALPEQEPGVRLRKRTVQNKQRDHAQQPQNEG